MNWITSLFTPKEKGGQGTTVKEAEEQMKNQTIDINKSPLLNHIGEEIKSNPIYEIKNTLEDLPKEIIKNELIAQGINGIVLNPKEEIPKEIEKNQTNIEEPTNEIKEDSNEKNKNSFDIKEMMNKLWGKEEQNEENKNDINYEELMNKLWEREDTIRKETQKREDSAYQRAVEDMRKAGINPNLIGINPANSGGGITQATNIMGSYSDLISSKTNIGNAILNATTSQLIAQMQAENTLNMKEMEIALNKYIAELQNDTTINENTKKNLLGALQSILQLGGNLAMFMLFKGNIK